MPLLSDLRQSGGHFLYNLLNAPGSISAVGAGVTASASASGGSATGYVTVTFTSILDAPGSIFHGWGQPWGNFTGTPHIGDTCRYPTNNGFAIAPDGSVSANAYGTYVCYYNDGTGEVPFTVVIDNSSRVYAGAAAASVIAAVGAVYGGVNVVGSGATRPATPATGTASSGNIAVGAGAQATTSAPGATVSGPGAASGAGAQATTTPSTGIAETAVGASGAGAQATTTPASGSATGAQIATGSGVTATAEVLQAHAVGDLVVGAIPYEFLFVVLPEEFLEEAQQ